MKQCRNCGHIHNAPNFCPNCGTPVATQVPEERGILQAPQSPPRAPAPAAGNIHSPAPAADAGNQKKRLIPLLTAAAVVFAVAAVLLIVIAGGDGTGKGVVELKEDVIYTDYDITGDGAADELKVEYRSYHETGYVAEADIFVNGEKAQTFSGSASIRLYLLSPEKNNMFISPSYHFKGGPTDISVCKYKDGTLEECMDENVFYLTQGEITGAAKGCISAKVNTFKYEAWLVSTETTLSFEAFYDVNGDTAVLRSNMLPACETYKLAANKTFTASSSPTENDEAGCFVSEGDTVKITGCCISDGNVSFGIECKGNTGWVSRDVSSGYAEPLFCAK